MTEHRKDLAKQISFLEESNNVRDVSLSLVNKQKLIQLLRHLLDDEEFLSPFGIRSLSMRHQKHPFKIKIGDSEYVVDYEVKYTCTWLLVNTQKKKSVKSINAAWRINKRFVWRQLKLERSSLDANELFDD